MNLLSKSLPDHASALARLRTANPFLAEMATMMAGPGSQQGLFPVPITGYRTSIQDCIREGLRHALGLLAAAPGVQNLLDDTVLWSDRSDSRATVHIVRELCALPRAGCQATAVSSWCWTKWASRWNMQLPIPAVPICTCCRNSPNWRIAVPATPFICRDLHQSFDRYAGYVDSVGQSEWAKIQGRFQDIAFQEPPNQQLWLLANALEYTASAAELEQAWPDAAAAPQRQSSAICFPPHSNQRTSWTSVSVPCRFTRPPWWRCRLCSGAWRRTNARCLPICLHWSHVASKSFWQNVTAPARISLADLFDYIAANLQGRLYSTLRARPLTEALEKIESDVKLSAVAIAALKTIGMLNWLSEIGPFKATAENVTYAMRALTTPTTQIAEALQELAAAFSHRFPPL